MTAAERVQVDDALTALTEVTVALASLYPILVVANVPTEARGFIEDGMEAASRARRCLNELRPLTENGLHSVRVVP